MNIVESQQPEFETSELVLVRLPGILLGELRLICQSTDRTLSEELRTGAAMRRDELRRDPNVLAAIVERQLELAELYGQFEQ